MAQELLLWTAERDLANFLTLFAVRRKAGKRFTLQGHVSTSNGMEPMGPEVSVQEGLVLDTPLSVVNDIFELHGHRIRIAGNTRCIWNAKLSGPMHLFGLQ